MLSGKKVDEIDAGFEHSSLEFHRRLHARRGCKILRLNLFLSAPVNVRCKEFVRRAISGI